MTPEIALVLFILALAIILLVTEWIPMEAVALLALGAVALTELVSTTEALSGFSNPAVVTVWAVFILSGGLTRTGVANVIGRFVLKVAGRREAFIVLVIMVSAGVMSAFMNNVAVAALMLPVVMDIARQTGHAPSRLLMPLAYGSLLGGLTTLIGTPPNILVSEVLRENGMIPFKLFDYTPVGVLIMLAGTAFMVLIGRHLLPAQNVAREYAPSKNADLRDQYDLRERMFLLRVPPESMLVGKTLAESRMGSALDLNVVGIVREGETKRAPDPSTVLAAGDCLLVGGRLARMQELKDWRQLVFEEESFDINQLFSKDMNMAEVRVRPGSPFTGKTLYEIGFQNRFKLSVLALRRGAKLRRTKLPEILLRAKDVLLVLGPEERLEKLKSAPGCEQFRYVSRPELTEVYHLHERLLVVSIPPDSTLTGKTLKESRLGDALSMRVLCIIREGHKLCMPDPEESLRAGDRLAVLARKEDFFVLQGLEGLQVDREIVPDLAELESDHVGLMEAVLAPRTRLAGMTLRQLHFREKYGLRVLAIWREGRAYRSNLRDMALRLGDAFLMYGPRDRLQLLGQEPDFIVLTEAAQEAPRLEKAYVSMIVMGAVLLPVILGLVPIYIAAVIGAACMVITRCLTMEEAYRAIEWKAVFLIAGMLPLGTALDQTGAAKYLASGVVAMVGPFGPLAVIFGLMALTFLATCIIPTAALVVLMAPIALSTSADLGLSPYATMMAIAMAASASFMTPISHPANVLVMGPGGYRFIDYIKVGLPLSIVVLIVVLIFLPFFWPLV